MADWWDNILTNVGQGLSSVTTNPQLVPALSAAYHFYNQADKYGNMGTQLGKDANPFGDRQMYRQGLDNLYANPDSIANTAAYKFKRDQGLGILGPQLAAKGGGFGNTERALIDYASGLASTEYDKEWQRLYEAAGGKFDPANAAKMQLDAARLEAESKGAALDSLFTPWKNNGGTTVNNNNSGGGGSSGGSGNPLNRIPGSSLPIGSGGSAAPWLTTAGTAGKWITDGVNKGMWQMNDGTVIDTDKLYAAAQSGDPEAIQIANMISQNVGVGTGTGFFNWDDGSGIGITDPGFVGESPIAMPTDPIVDIPQIEDNLSSWWGYEELGD